MKKLLSLLSVLTISGTAVPTTIAASPYQKEETIKNIDINYLEINNNLEKLNRIKRDKISDESCRNKITLGAGVAGGAGVGAATGAAIGSIVPGIGTAIGAGLGAIVGAFSGAGVGGGVGFSEAPDACAKEIGEFFLNTDLKIINDDNNNTILKQTKKLNQSLNIDNLYVTDKNNTSAKIVVSSTSIYKTESYVIVKFINQRNLNSTPDLLKNWSDNFHKWKNEFDRQKKEDVPSFTVQQKRTWKDDKNFQIRSQFHSLLQNIVIIQNNSYIKELYERIVSLENDLNNLKIKVDQLSSSDSLSLCGSSTNFISSSSSIVPVVGDIVSYVSGLISASCFLANEFN